MVRRKLLVVLLLLISTQVFAQYTGTIRGQVVDPQGAVVPGVTLTLSGPNLQGKRTAVTQADGHYLFLGLPPGLYQVEAQQQGFQRFEQSGLELRAGATLDFEIRFSVVGMEASVVTTGSGADTPIIDTTSPELKFNISGEFINKLPLSSRQNWESIWFLVPGAVTIGRGGPDGVAFDPIIHGASPRSNVFKLDSFDISNSFTNQGFTTQFSTEVIQDVQLKTAGVDASTPLGQGGYINLTTKSGNNRFSGSAAIFYQPRSFNWTNVPGGIAADQQLIQPDLSLGGPVKKDQTWFFVSHRQAYITTGIPRTAEVLQSFVDNGFPKPTYSLDERHHRLFAKLSHQLRDRHHLTFSYLNDHSLTLNSDSRDLGTRETTIDLRTGGPAYIVAWNAAPAHNWLLNMQYGYRSINENVETNGGDQPSVSRFATTTISGGNLTGQTLILLYGNRAGSAAGSKGVRDHHELISDLSYVKSGWLGQHTLQTGLQWKPKTRIKSETIYPESGLVLTDEIRRPINGQPAYLPFHRQFRNPLRFISIQGTTYTSGFYVLDKWMLASGLTLNLGIRVDRQANRDTFDERRIDSWSVGPRVGAAYSLTRGGRDVIRVSWGRIHDVLYNQAAPSIGNRAPERRDEYDNDLDGRFETVLVTPAVGIDGQPTILNQTVNPRLHAPFTDEFHLSYTRQLPKGFVFDFAYLYRKFQESIGTRDINIIYENNLFAGYKDPNFNAITQTTNLTHSFRRYQALEFSLIRNLGARLQAFASYAWQRQSERGDFSPDEITGYLNPRHWFSNDKLARPHILHLNASYYLPWRLTIAAIFSLHSGEYSGPLVRDLAADDPEVAAHGPRMITLSNGRTVSNPLYTLRRLAGPRSQGQIQLPSIPRLNLRFGKEFRLKETQSLEANLDFFNITNDATPMLFRNNANNISTPQFGQVSSSVQSPRGAQLSLRYRF